MDAPRPRAEPDPNPPHGDACDSPLVVVMGVSGSGKSTLAAALAAQLGWSFIEADDCHPSSNRARMAAGLPLDDGMREPWVAEVSCRVVGSRAPVLLAFSGLRQAHRKRLSALRRDVLFLHLQVPTAMLEYRLRQRVGHFMPPELLGSQLAALEPVDADTPVVCLDGSVEADALLREAQRTLSGWPAAQRWMR